MILVIRSLLWPVPGEAISSMVTASPLKYAEVFFHCRTLSDVSHCTAPSRSEVMRKREAEVAAATAEVDKIQEASDALLAAMPHPEDGLKLLDAMAARKEDVMQEIMQRQPLEWQMKWADLFTRSQKFI